MKPIHREIVVVLVLLFGCDKTKHKSNAVAGPDVWIAMEPKQCMSNAWERDWEERNNSNPHATYPNPDRSLCIGQAEFEIMRDFYAQDGVVVIDAAIAGNYGEACAGCDCPKGYTLFLFVRAQDVETMTTRRGFRTENPPSPKCDDGVHYLSGLLERTPVFAICALADVLPGVDSIRTLALGEDWNTFGVVELVGRARPETIDPTVAELNSQIRSLPKREAADVAWAVQQWLKTYEQLVRIRDDGVEAFATGVAFVPEIADALPADIARRAPKKEDVGDTLASAEHTALVWALLNRLSGMTGRDRWNALHQLEKHVDNGAP